MRVEGNFTQSEQFYEELIKKFFHTKSYFYYCLKNFLNSNSSLKKQLDNSTSEIISQLIEFLVKVKDPIHEIKEISNAQKFKDFYKQIKNKLSQINLANLDNTQTKNIIHDLALTTLEDLVEVFSDENNRFILQSYLDLKARLQFLLDNSNGSNFYINTNFMSDIESNGYLNAEKADLIDQTSILAGDVLSDQHKESVGFQKFFKEEVRSIIKPLTGTEGEQLVEADFLNKSSDAFFKLVELGKFHNNPELTIISEKLFQLIKKAQKNELQTGEVVFDLVRTGNKAIEKFVFFHHSPEELNKFLDKFNDVIVKASINEQKNLPPNDKAKDEQEILNIVKKNETENRTSKENNFSLKSNTNLNIVSNNLKQPIADDNLKKDILQFTLPGEDDEDLMNLIQEISSSMTVSAAAQRNEAISDTISPENITLLTNSTDPILHQSFYKEASRFTEVILKAISHINEKIEIKAQLEDIEFASSALKTLAIRCKFDEIAFLPELIESICINVKAVKITLPHSILEKIKQGVQLLNEFNPENKNHESELITILSSLKEYYSFTIRAIEKAPVNL